MLIVICFGNIINQLNKSTQVITQFPADLVTFTKEILNEKLHFLSSELCADQATRKGNNTGLTVMGITMD